MNNEAFRKAATKEDIAKALLVTVTNNIGSISLNAAVCQVKKLIGLFGLLFVNFINYKMAINN